MSDTEDDLHIKPEFHLHSGDFLLGSVLVLNPHNLYKVNFFLANRLCVDVNIY